MNKGDKITDYQLIIDQLKKENELKTRWLSLISHDFKGLFSNMKMLLDALESNSISQEVFISMLPELRQHTEQNIKTIESTFVWVKAQADGFNPKIENVHIYNLLLRLQDELKEDIEKKSLSIKFVGDEQLSLHTDIFLLRFVLKQIVENAIKYSTIEGEIKLQVQSHSHGVDIIIQDEGVGMSESVVESVGTLAGASYTGTMQEKGAGLSLVIVKDFMKLLNGQINISSVKNKGTSVELTFPHNL